MGRILAVFVVTVLLIGMLPSSAVDSQSPITVLEQSLITDYKKSATFHLKVATTAGTITKVRLTWHSRANKFLNRPTVTFTPAQEIVAEYAWPMQTLPYVPWDYLYATWEITDSAGNKLVTPETALQVQDSTRTWKELKADNIAVYTYDQPESAAQAIMDSVRPDYERLTKKLNLTSSEPLVIVLYNTAEDICATRVVNDCDPGRLAMQANYITGPGLVSMLQNTDQAEFNAFLGASTSTAVLFDWLVLPTIVTDFPIWLGNGIYFYYMPNGQAERTQRVRELAAQGQLMHLDLYSGAYEAAYVARDKARLMDVFAMESSTVTFLVEKVGEDGLMKMFTLMKSGKNVQASLKEVTGYDFATFEAAWSEWAGAKDPFVVVPTPTDSFTFPPNADVPAEEIVLASAAIISFSLRGRRK